MDWIYVAQDMGKWRTFFEHGGEHTGSIKMFGNS
jgi:hypothetical protein